MKKTLALALILLLQQTGILAHGGAGWGVGAGLVGAGIIGAAIASHHNNDYYDEPIVVAPEESTRYADRAVNEEDINNEYVAGEEMPERTHTPKTTKESDTKFHSSSNYAQESTLDDGDGDNTDDQDTIKSTAPTEQAPEVAYEKDED